jgi:hypothetical protein
MDEIDYKQEAKNILYLLDKDVDRKVISAYVEWISSIRFWKTNIKFLRLRDAFLALNLPIPTEEEWKKR